MKYQLNSGYSLIECLITIVLIMTLLTLGVTSYHYLIARNKAMVYSSELMTALYYARSEALKRHLPVTICKSHDGQQCGGAWREGWLIFFNSSNKAQPENAAQILRIYQALPPGDQLIWRSSLYKNDFIQFDALGNTRQAGTFTYCPHNNTQQASAIIISFSGRVRIEQENGDNALCQQNKT